MYFIISEQMVIILHIEVIQSALMCYSERKKMYSAVNLHSDDVIKIRENQNFHLRLFVKSGSLHLLYTSVIKGTLRFQ
jgi:hypothetical protein